MNEFQRCLKEGRIQRVDVDGAWVSKELEEAGYDLGRASESLDAGDFKWSIVQSYYAMFHGAKALVLQKGYREKSHLCLLIALRQLCVSGGSLGNEHAVALEEAMDLRHQADYGLEYARLDAEMMLENAEAFLEAVKRLSGSLR
jgi:uncharacterized protein (UPF0332 family)